MAAILMGKAKNRTSASGDTGDDGKKKTSLKVSIPTGALIGKLAAHRRKSVEELFLMKDVEDFFTHLLLEEMRVEAARLQGQRKP